MIASGDDCVGASSFQNLDGCALDDYTTYGDSSSAAPDVSNQVVSARISGSCPGSTAPRTRTVGDILSTGTTESWYVTGGTNDFLDCNQLGGCSSPDNSGCNGVYEVTIQGAASGGKCDSYNNVYTSLEAYSVTAARMMNPAADCSSGGGRFQLVPIQAANNDGDDRYSIVYMPIQKTGGGVMTRASWVTSIDSINIPSGYTIRVIHSDSTFSWGSNDELVNASQISTVLGASNTFNSGVIDGNPIFVVEEVSDTDLMDFSLDIQWTCGGAYTAANSPQGYQFRLSDIGCTGYNQRLTLRYASSPNRVSLEQYGTSAVSRTEPTATVVDGEAFVFDREGLLIDGVLLSHSPSSATVRLDTIQAGGINVCQTGTYVFSAE